MGRKSNLVSRREHSSMQRRLDSILSVHADLELRLHETAKRMRMLQLHSMQSCLKNRWNFHRATSSASFCSVVIGFGFARRFTSTRRPHQAWSVSEELVRCEQSFTVCRNFWNEAQKAQCPLRRLRRCASPDRVDPPRWFDLQVKTGRRHPLRGNTSIASLGSVLRICDRHSCGNALMLHFGILWMAPFKDEDKTKCPCERQQPV